MDMNDLMKQAQQMQEKMSKLQDQSQNVEVRGESGAGLVSVIMTGRHDIKEVHIDDSILSEDKEFLEDLVAAAFNDAVIQFGVVGVTTLIAIGLPVVLKMEENQNRND